VNLSAELELARTLARRAGQILLAHYDQIRNGGEEAASVALMAADQASYEAIAAGIAEEFSDDALLSEESKESAARLECDRCWIIDPLDGTREFSAGNGEFSVLIGLAIAGEPCVGAIYHPTTGSLYSAARGEGASIARGEEETTLRVSDISAPERMLMVVSRSHRDTRIDDVQYLLGVSNEIACGSVGLKVGLVAEQRGDFYVHPSGHTKAWDTCASQVILGEAGGKMTDCYGAPVKYNERDVLNHRGVLASNGLIHDQLVEATVRAIRGELDDDEL
jgi:3'(2'), 5'-bisphosphate nucleotidase